MAVKNSKSRKKIDWADFNVKIAIAYGIFLIVVLLLVILWKLSQG